MHRSDREITDRKEIDRIIRSCQVCRVAFAVDNEPYIVPLSFGYDGQALYFHTANAGRKIEAVSANNWVCFEFDCHISLRPDDEVACNWGIDYESVIGFGSIREMTAIDEKIRGLNHIMQQYSGREWDLREARIAATRIWQLKIDSVTGKRSTGKPADQSDAVSTGDE